MSAFFEDIKNYVGFTDRDAAALAEFRERAAPHFGAIAESFYDRILEHEGAHAAITGGVAQVERLKRTLVDWMDSGLRGPHDRVFYERRARIGRMHVKIRLPQRYMFTAMNAIRLDFRALVEELIGDDDRPRARVVNDAIDRLLDMELAIMLHTYSADSGERLKRQERLATIGQLAGSIAHDLRNPLGVVQSSIYILRKRIGDDPQVRRHVEKIAVQVETSSEMVSDMLEMARGRPPRRGPIDLVDLFREVQGGTRIPEDVTVHREVDGAVDLHADPGLLRQAVMNLLGNAVSVMEERGGNVYLAARSEREMVVIEVSDDGPGFDLQVLPTVFEPLVTTRAKGTGLGLALVKSVVERHGGSVEAGNRPEGGAVVRIILPVGADSRLSS